MASPLPYFASGEVVKGFGRGCKELGIPTDKLVSDLLFAFLVVMMFKAWLPFCTYGRIVKGFGRGSSQLLMPTANYPEEVVDVLPDKVECGIYYGWAQVDNGEVYKMVMNIGWCPFYRNKQKSMETHILHEFPEDFYGATLKVAILGYLRPEKSFPSIVALIEAIQEDIRQARLLLDLPENLKYRDSNFFKTSIS